MTQENCAGLSKSAPLCGHQKVSLRSGMFVVAALLLLSCQSNNPQDAVQTELVVAAAANLTEAFNEIGNAFTEETGIRILYNFGATTQLTQQIENGAPFDVFAAADTVHVDRLVQSGKVREGSRRIYARGRLALWVPNPAAIAVEEVRDLLQPLVRFIAIANPEIAPYGAATVEVLENQNLWAQVQPKIVRAENVNAAKQLAATGNADVVFTANSLLLDVPGRVILIDESLHTPIDQALGIVTNTTNLEPSQRFADFVTGEKGREILRRFGYDFPPS